MEIYWLKQKCGFEEIIRTGGTWEVDENAHLNIENILGEIDGCYNLSPLYLMILTFP